MKYFILFSFFLAVSGCSEKHATLPEGKKENAGETVKKDAAGKKNIPPEDYLIGPTDSLEILYHTDYKADKYIIDTEDKLRIEFQYYPELKREVIVRPDGFITLARIGEIKAAGERPLQLAEKISKRYSEELRRPDVTVDVLEFDAKISRLRDVVRSTFLGQFKFAVVRPDGKISLPYLQKDVVAAGKTALSLSEELKSYYSKIINNIDVTVSISEAKSYQACVAGDVRNTGCYTLSGADTLLQTISRAGGFTSEANLKQVIIIRRDEKGQPTAIPVNVEDIIYKKNFDKEIKQYDVIYVPRTWLSEASLTADALRKFIPIIFTAAIYQDPY